jgi:hypothetical protein
MDRDEPKDRHTRIHYATDYPSQSQLVLGIGHWEVIVIGQLESDFMAGSLNLKKSFKFAIHRVPHREVSLDYLAVWLSHGCAGPVSGVRTEDHRAVQ